MYMISLLLTASSQLVACPATIRDSQDVAYVAGWSIVVPKSDRKLSRASVYVGKPKDRMVLQPIPGKNGRKVWELGPADTWIECSYEGSAAILTKNLGSVTSCVFTPQKGGTSTPASITCKRR